MPARRLAWPGWPMRVRASRAAEALSRDEEIDRTVLLGVIDELRFEEEELDELSWSAITYSYLLGGGLFALLSREFAPASGSAGAAPPVGWRESPPSSMPRAQI